MVRFTRDRPCPICGGWKEQPQGQGVRCWGFLSDDGEFAHCTRVPSPYPRGRDEESYPHKMTGKCGCGEVHDVSWRGDDRSSETVHIIRGVDGHIQGRHHRIGSGPGKRVWWSDLNGTSPKDMAYGAERLSRLPDAKVVLVEGEPAADAATAVLRDRAVVLATVCGAGSVISDEVARWLVGREVFVWPDHDPDGYQHMLAVEKVLRAAGVREVRWVLPDGAREKDDAANYLRNHTLYDLTCLLRDSVPIPPDQLDRFRSLDLNSNGANSGPSTAILDPGPPLREGVQGPEIALPTMEEMIEQGFTPPPAIVEGLLPAGGSSLLVAKPKVGKSVLGRCLCYSVAAGEPWLDRRTTQGPTIYVALEGPYQEHWTHISKIVERGRHVPAYFHAGPAPKEALTWLALAIGKYKPVLVAIDPLFKFLKFRDDKDYADIMEKLGQVIDASAPHLMFLHHSPKRESEDPADAALGSTALFASVDTQIVLSRTPQGVRSIVTRQRCYDQDIEDPRVLLLDKESGRVALGTALARSNQERIEGAIMRFIENEGGDSPLDAIWEQEFGKKNDVTAALAALVSRHRLTVTGRGVRGDRKVYHLVEPKEWS